MFKSKLSLIISFLSLFFIISCNVSELDEGAVASEEVSALKQTTKYLKINDQSLNKATSIEKASYVEPFDLELLPVRFDDTHIKLREINYLGNLGPFPTKSLQSYMVLKQHGVVDSYTVNLGGFYLLEGAQTEITDLIERNADNINDGRSTEETVKNIMDWVRRNLRCSEDERDQYQKRERTSHQIIESRCATGCTDYTLAFVALARSKGISATVTEAIREKWIAQMVWSNEWNPAIEGHFYSEVFLPEMSAWVVADPTSNKLTKRDDHGYYTLKREGSLRRCMLFERGLDTWDYGISTIEELADVVRKRFYVQRGDQP